MVTAPSRAIALFGTDEPVRAEKRLRAGPLTADLDGDVLRHVRINGKEAIRMIAFTVDLEGAGASRAILENQKIGQGPQGFEASFDALCKHVDQGLRYGLKVKGSSDGTLVFEVTGQAITDLESSRIGIAVTYPTCEFAGRPVQVERANGASKIELFPKLIDPDCPIRDLRALTYEVLPGVEITCRMVGGSFDVEDLRNCGIACFSARPREPLKLKAGDVIEQSATVSLSGEAPAVLGAGGDPVRLMIGKEVGAVPAIGLSLPPEQDQFALQVVDFVEKISPQFLVCPFDSRIAHGAPKGLAGARFSTVMLDDPRLDGRGEIMRMFKRLGEATGAELVLEAVLACQDHAGTPSADEGIMRRDLALIRKAADDANVRFDRVAVSPASDLKCMLSRDERPPAPDSVLTYDTARRVFPDTPIGGGVFSYFSELNRRRPPIEAIDFICHTTCPTVHAADDITVMETLEALSDMVDSVRAFAGGLPYHIGPSTIGARANPVGDTAVANPQNRRLRLARMDPRQRGLFGAAWNLGYVAHLARAGVETVALSAPVGEFGMIYAPLDYEQPWFDQQGSGVYPVYHVIRALAAGAGKPMLGTDLSDGSTVQAIAWRDGNRTMLCIANLTGEPQEVRIEGLPTGRARTATLDLDTFIAATGGPDGLEAEEGMASQLDLGAYGFVWIEVVT
jgi:hypothetical protein